MEPRNPTGGIPCKFFAEGTCRQGDNCKFSHDVGRVSRGARGGEFRGRGDYSQRRQPDESREDFNRPYGQHSGPRQQGYNPRPEYGREEGTFERRGGRFEGSWRGGPPREQTESQGYNRYERKEPYRENDRSFNQPSYQHKPMMVDSNQQIGSKRIDLLAQNDRIKQLNVHRQANGIAKLFINEILTSDNMIIMTVKEKNFVIVYDLSTGTLMDSQIYINTNINDMILKIRKGMFGKLGTEFAIVGYTKFNEVAIKMSSFVLITPVSELFNHMNFINLEISTEAAIDNILVSEEYLFVSCYNQSGVKR